MTEPIVVGVDASAPSRAAAEWAAEDARLRGLPLRVVHIEGAEPVGGIAAALLSLGSRASCIVLGLRGEDGVPVPAVGSVAHEVAARSNPPVVLVPGGGHGRRGGEWRAGQVVLGVDAREPASAVVDFAFDAARRRGARLHAVHAWRLPSRAERWMPYALPEEDRGAWEDQEVQLLSDALRPWREKYPQVDVYEDVRLLSPSAALLQASASAELLVVGRAGRTLGPTVRDVLEHTEYPVAVVPH
ncbi:universal stress protein [Streptomyces mirabilis]|jgi:nucleotide-binding universal stress UspA family protein|uniref:universal stress protein n=1 Tax=Streptomyces mirabilis TaxID=68239 RepID=UPI00225A0E26|nr:universal stress protein [Streptomyces mirabilis]MCX4418764.1 universal stress protein [Streptomyces mirabilis]